MRERRRREEDSTNTTHACCTQEVQNRLQLERAACVKSQHSTTLLLIPTTPFCFLLFHTSLSIETPFSLTRKGCGILCLSLSLAVSSSSRASRVRRSSPSLPEPWGAAAEGTIGEGRGAPAPGDNIPTRPDPTRLDSIRSDLWGTKRTLVSIQRWVRNFQGER
jgi:hypothetical protein